MTRPSKTTTNVKGTAAFPAVGDLRWWAVAIVSGLVAYVATSHQLFLFGWYWQVPLFVGCVVGLVAVAPLQAIPVASGVTLVSMVLLERLQPVTAVDWVLALVLSAIGAAVVSYPRAALRGDRRKHFGLAVSAVLIAWTLVNLWTPLLAKGLPVSAYGPQDSKLVTTVPQPGTYVNDDAIYRRVYYLMHQGEAYYPAFRDAWLGVTDRGGLLPNSVFAYRLPTFFWIWRLLPADPFSIVYLFLVLCSIGVVGAGFIAGQLVGARFAPLAAVALAAYAFSVGTSTQVMYVDLPAACVALVGVALLVRARLKGDRSMLWAAAGVLTLAALTREILAYLIVLAALSALLESPGKRLREATPWLCAAGVFSLGYAAHAVAVSPYVSPSSGVLSYLGGSPSYAFAALTEFGYGFNGHEAALVALFIMGVLGAFAAHRRVGWPFSAFASAALILPIVAMMRIGNSGISEGGVQINYWGLLVFPLALSLWPVWALFLSRER